MKTSGRSKSGLFLMELIIVIMFFALCAAICMQVFSNAKVKTDYSRNVSNASFAAQSIAELYKEKDGDLTETVAKYDGELKNDNIASIYFDKDWNAVSKSSESVFTTTLTKTNEKGLSKVLIEIKDQKDKEIFSIVVADVD